MYHKSTNSPKVRQLNRRNKVIWSHFSYLLALQNLNTVEAEDQNVELEKFALQYYDVKKHHTSSMRSILYQCTSEKFLHIFLMINFAYLLCTLLKSWKGFSALWKLWKVIGVHIEALLRKSLKNGSRCGRRYWNTVGRAIMHI